MNKDKIYDDMQSAFSLMKTMIDYQEYLLAYIKRIEYISQSCEINDDILNYKESVKTMVFSLESIAQKIDTMIIENKIVMKDNLVTLRESIITDLIN